MRRKDDKLLSKNELLRWQCSRRGRQMLALEERQLKPVLSGLFGRHILQIGTWGHGRRLLAATEIAYRAVLGQIAANDIEALIDPEDLPIQTKSIDVVILPHTLEFVRSPHRLLREVDRILNDRGQLIILGFNRWSTLGMRERLGLFRSQLPPSGHLYSITRVCDWLDLLGLETTEIVRYGQTSSPNPERKKRGRLRLAHWASLISTNYLIAARKRVIPMNRVGARQKAKIRPLLGAGATPLAGVRSKQAPQTPNTCSLIKNSSSQ